MRGVRPNSRAYRQWKRETGGGGIPEGDGCGLFFMLALFFIIIFFLALMTSGGR
jgi:hypothetical protein